MLVEKKKMLEIHTNIFQAAFESVSARHVPSFSMLEQKLIDGSHADKSELLQLLANRETGSLADKMRLLMIYYLTSGATGTEIAEFEAAYQQVAAAIAPGADQAQQGATVSTTSADAYANAWKFIKKHTAFQQHASVGGALHADAPLPAHGAAGGASSGNMSKFKGLAQGFLAQAAASVKNFLPENKKLHVTRVTDAICDLRPNTEDETFLYLDPKVRPRHCV